MLPENRIFYESIGMKEDMLVLMEVLLQNINAMIGERVSIYAFSMADIKEIRDLQNNYFIAKKVWMELW